MSCGFLLFCAVCWAKIAFPDSGAFPFFERHKKKSAANRNVIFFVDFNKLFTLLAGKLAIFFQQIGDGLFLTIVRTLDRKLSGSVLFIIIVKI